MASPLAVEWTSPWRLLPPIATKYMLSSTHSVFVTGLQGQSLRHGGPIRCARYLEPIWIVSFVQAHCSTWSTSSWTATSGCSLTVNLGEIIGMRPGLD